MNKWWLFFLIPIIALYAVRIYADNPELLISEVQITSGTGLTTNDYIKIYNNTDNNLDLNGYLLVKRTEKAKTDAIIYPWNEPTLLIPRGFYLWANADYATTVGANCSSTSTISTDNSIAIRQNEKDTGRIVDAISWGNTSTTSLGLNKHFSNPSSGKIIINVGNNQDTNPPTGNPPAASSGGGGGVVYCQAAAGDVVINEFVSNPGEDDNEWIELFNNCGQNVSLDGWTIIDGAGGKTTLSGVLEKFLVIDSPKGQLNNAGDLIVLKNADSTVIDQILYGAWQEQTGPNAPAAGQSLARRNDGQDSDQTSDWASTTQPTKGTANIIKDDSTGNSTEETNATTTSTVIISEILPNPWGADDQNDLNNYEFIELYNASDQEINLSGWRLAAGEQKAYLFGETILPAKNYLLLKRISSGLVLNNDKETLKLYKPNAATAQQSVSYTKAPEGLSYVYLTATKTWGWSLAKSPGAANVLIGPNQAPRAVISGLPAKAETGQEILFDAADSFDPEGVALTFAWEFSDGLKSATPSLWRIFDKNQEISAKLTVSDGSLTASQNVKIKIGPSQEKISVTTVSAKTTTAAPTTAADSGGQFKLRGIVVVEPGVFGKQIFYIFPLNEAEQASDTVLQIYQYRSQFPALKQGDLVEASGELSDLADGISRLKIKDADAVIVLDHNYIVTDKTVECGQIKPALANQIITVSGQLTEKSGSLFYLDDGSGEMLVELKSGSGLKAGALTVGERYQITGLLKNENDRLKLLPRNEADLVKLSQAEVAGDKIIAEQAKASSAPITYAANTKKEKLWQYLLVVAAGIIIGLVILLFKSGVDKNAAPQ